MKTPFIWIGKVILKGNLMMFPSCICVAAANTHAAHRDREISNYLSSTFFSVIFKLLLFSCFICSKDIAEVGRKI